MEEFTLLLSTSIECSYFQCYSIATHILLKKGNKFLGFYCETHGLIRKEKLESKFQFEKENRFIIIKLKRKKNKNDTKKKMSFLPKRIYRKKKRQGILQKPMPLPSLVSENQKTINLIEETLSRPLFKLTCWYCSQSFETNKVTDKYCSSKCNHLYCIRDIPANPLDLKDLEKPPYHPWD